MPICETCNTPNYCLTCDEDKNFVKYDLPVSYIYDTNYIINKDTCALLENDVEQGSYYKSDSGLSFDGINDRVFITSAYISNPSTISFFVKGEEFASSPYSTIFWCSSVNVVQNIMFYFKSSTRV